MSIKLSIADDHSLITNGIINMLKGNPLITLVHTAETGLLLLENIKRIVPDVLLLDIQLPDKQGDELSQIISSTYPNIQIIALTNMNQTYHVRNMFMCGVKGYLLKSVTQHKLIEAIESVSRGHQYIDETLREQMAFEMVENRQPRQIPVLTKREKQILEMIANQKTNIEIASDLFLSVSTVENHRINLFLKLDVKNAAGLVRKAIQLGMIS